MSLHSALFSHERSSNSLGGHYSGIAKNKTFTSPANTRKKYFILDRWMKLIRGSHSLPPIWILSFLPVLINDCEGKTGFGSGRLSPTQLICEPETVLPISRMSTANYELPSSRQIRYPGMSRVLFIGKSFRNSNKRTMKLEYSRDERVFSTFQYGNPSYGSWGTRLKQLERDSRQLWQKSKEYSGIRCRDMSFYIFALALLVVFFADEKIAWHEVREGKDYG